MLSDRLRSRLAQLNRQPLPVVRDAGKTVLRTAAEMLDRPSTDSVVRKRVARQSSIDHGCEIETPLGKHLVIERPVSELWNRSEQVVARAQAEMQRDAGDRQQHADWPHFIAAFPQRCAFLDLETCGFAGSMVFLIGVIHDSPQGLVLSQILARNYSEEPAMLFTLWQIMQQRGTLLTFNGKSFDWPMVNDRSTLHRLDAAGHTCQLDAHIDLLHHGRRQYKDELPNCKLQTLERYLCGRRRVGDIPGSEIPDAYHHYVRTGDESEMRSILHHNALDLVTLLQLSLRFATA